MKNQISYLVRIQGEKNLVRGTITVLPTGELKLSYLATDEDDNLFPLTIPIKVDQIVDKCS